MRCLNKEEVLLLHNRNIEVFRFETSKYQIPEEIEGVLHIQSEMSRLIKFAGKYYILVVNADHAKMGGISFKNVLSDEEPNSWEKDAFTINEDLLETEISKLYELTEAEVLTISLKGVQL